MPRAGLNTAEVVASAADLADESGIGSVSLAAVAIRLSVKAPALYKHVGGIDDLRRRIATLAMTEMADALRDALQGKSGADAIGAFFMAVESYIAKHPGRYDATTGAQFVGRDDPLFVAASRVIGSIRAVLSGYGIRPGEIDHAIRMLRCTIHGYAALQAADGFQWSNDPNESVDWMIRFFDAGLTAVGKKPVRHEGRGR
jgi:AcrR family transcriptional regulator